MCVCVCIRNNEGEDDGSAANHPGISNVGSEGLDVSDLEVGGNRFEEFCL